MSTEKQEPVKKANNYLKYSSMAFQMVGSMLLGVLIGRWLDKITNSPKPYFTATLALLFTGAALYVTLRDFLAKK